MLTVGSLFAGIGGIELGLEWTGGFETKWQVEKDEYARRVLAKHWPDVKRYEDVREVGAYNLEAVDVLAGGDPCPIRSRARGHRAAKHPDLAGFFLAVAQRLRPEWIIRENVPAPDVVEFTVALECLGYRAFVVELDARDFTGQSRRRQFCIGVPTATSARFSRVVSDAADAFGFVSSSQQEETLIAACLTAHPNRMAAEDSYCYKPGRGLRVLASEEAEGLMGFPRGWTDGLSRSCRRRLLGNAVVPQVAQWIGERILDHARATR